MNEKRTDLYILRIAACLLVIITHISAGPMVALQGDNLPFVFYKVLNASSKFCVPLFVFLSAFLLTMNQRGANGGTGFLRYYRKVFGRLVAPYVLWLLAYYFVFVIKGVYQFSLKQILVGILTGNIVFHLYYMLISIQLYVFYPLLAKIRRTLGYLPLAVGAGLTTYFTGEIPIFMNYTHVLLGTYLAYAVLGMWLSENEGRIRLGARERGLLGILLHVGAATVFFHSYTPYFTNLKPYYITGSILGIAAVYFLSGFCAHRIASDGMKRWIQSVSASTEAVYYIHVAIMLFVSAKMPPQRYGVLFAVQLAVILACWLGLSVYHHFRSAKV